MTIPNLPIEDIIRAKFLTLPDQVQKTIKSPETSAAFRRIANRNGLTLDQTDDLENEAFFVMLGLEPPGDFVENLRKSLNISVDKARALGQDVNQEIFRSIREELKEIHGLGKSDEKPPASNERIQPAVPAALPRPTAPQTTPVVPIVKTPLVDIPNFSESGLSSPEKDPKLSLSEEPQKFDALKLATPPAWNEEPEVTPSREEILKEIEGAGGLRTPSGDILAEKLAKPTAAPRKQTDYTIKKEDAPPKPGQDPYREPPE